jgi:plastocyanin
MQRIRRFAANGVVLLPAILLPAILLAIASCGGGGGGYGGSTPTQPSGPKVVTVELREHRFEPKSVLIEPGDTVRWVMAGADPTHTVSARDGSFDSGAVFTSSGAAYERRFDTPGRTHEYYCNSHQGCCQMQGSVRVGMDAPNPNPGY